MVCLSIASLSGADKKDAAFRPKPASEYTNRQKGDGVLIAVEAFTGGEKVKAAFGKNSPYDHGVLPVLVVIDNTGTKTLNFAGLRVEYVASPGDRIENTPAADVPFLKAPSKPKPGVIYPIPLPRGKKNPLAAPEIQARAFSAKMLPPNDSANGFFYFQTDHRAGAQLYITGIEEAGTGKQLFYMEIPLPE